MPSPYLYAICRNVLNDHHVVGLFADALQHNVLTCGFLDGHQFILYPIFLDEARVLLLAHLAIKFLEIVLNGASHDLLLDF